MLKKLLLTFSLRNPYQILSPPQFMDAWTLCVVVLEVPHHGAVSAPGVQCLHVGQWCGPLWRSLRILQEEAILRVRLLTCYLKKVKPQGMSSVFTSCAFFQNFARWALLLCTYSFMVINQQEWPNSHSANGGFIYMQNARPNGPAVWLFTEVRWNAKLYLDIKIARHSFIFLNEWWETPQYNLFFT
jgi:hypothetical protein